MDIRQAILDKLPQLQLGQMRTYLYAYRVAPYGIFFAEANENGELGGDVNFVTSGVILKAAGQSYRDDEIGRLLAKNAIQNVLSVPEYEC